MLLGIDLGTTAIKALVFDPDRPGVAGMAKAPTPVTHPRPTWSECEPQQLWQCVCEAVTSALACAPQTAKITALAVSSMGESGLAVDQHGQPLRPIILYFDPRGAEFIDDWEKGVGAERIHTLTGQILRPIFAANKLLWLRQYEPQVWGQLAGWLSVGDFVISKLCGRRVTDWTLASRTMLFDQQRRDWSDELIERVGLRRMQLPEIAPSGTVVGKLSRTAADELGLQPDVLVVTGGHDHLCGALACGVIRRGEWLDSMGTAAALLVLAPEFRGGGEVYRAGFSCYPHVAAGAYVIQGGLSAAGAGLAWLAEVCGMSPEQLMAEATLSPPGARGLVWLPFFRGSGTPHRDSSARGLLTGLSIEHGRADLARALCEGLAFWVRDNITALEQVAGERPGHLRLTGGANQHPLVGQLKADVLGCEASVAAGTETSALGAALLAGVGSGAFTSTDEAARAADIQWQSFRPDETRRNLYDRLFVQAYGPLYQAALKTVKSDK